MLAFLVYFFTAVGILLPAAEAWLSGKAPLAVSQFSSTFIGPPGLFLTAALFAVFTPRFAGCLAFAGATACWVYSGPNVVRAFMTVFSSQTVTALSKMEWLDLAIYIVRWLPTFLLIFTTFYALRKAMKIETPRNFSTPESA